MSSIPEAARPTRTIRLPEYPDGLHHGDHMDREEFHRRYLQTPKEFKAELINGMVYVSWPVTFRDKEGNEYLLDNGDHMDRETFHRIYRHAPPELKAELVGGVVYMASPLKITHGKHHPRLSTLFFTYEAKTPGVETGDNATVKLAREAEPQPDLFLRILPECGGRTKTVDDYVVGPPECLAEIAVSSESFDLHTKRVDYQRHGVLEYLVLLPASKRLRWFDLAAGRELDPPPDGIIRLATFPGLWIDVAALFAKNHARMMAALERGLASEEHAEFVRRLAAAAQGGVA